MDKNFIFVRECSNQPFTNNSKSLSFATLNITKWFLPLLDLAKYMPISRYLRREVEIIFLGDWWNVYLY